MNTRADVAWITQGREIDRGIVIGIAVSFFLISVGVAYGGSALNFIDPQGLLIVMGGTIGGTMVNYSVYDLRQAWLAFKTILFTKAEHAPERIGHLVGLSHLVRQNGLLVLEREARSTDDTFLRKALELTVDGQQTADVRRILETEMRTSNDRSARAISVFETMGNYAPAMGLIGTLIGLIRMLTSLDNPATVGPAMSVALVATFYGAVLANLVFLPIAGKLKNRNEEQALVKAITIEGITSLGKQENPIVIEQRLQSFLPLSPE